MTDKPLLTVPEFCRHYNVSRSLLYRMLREEQIVAVKVGRLTRIRREDADAWARRLANYKPKAA